MKKMLPLLALFFVLSVSACTKKEEAAQPETEAPQAEGTTSKGSESSAENPPEEMQQKKDGAAE
jgi:hypothetical protein